MTPSRDVDVRNTFSDEEVERLYRDGFVIFRNVVPEHKVRAARRANFEAIGKARGAALAVARGADDESSRQAIMDTARTGEDERILRLFSDTPLRPLIESALGGPAVSPRGAQLATTFPTEPGEHVNESGYPDIDTPFHGWHGHLDGLWNGHNGTHQRVDVPMTPAQRSKWEQSPGTNSAPRTYPEHNSNIANFTALLGVALSDQRAEGIGNLGLLAGAHHHFEAFFRRQRELGGPLGPDGPDWPRVHNEAPNGAGLRHYPEAIREAFANDAARTPDGRVWPRPTYVDLAPGDAVLALHAVPHCATLVDNDEPRIMVYFRIRPESRPPGNEVVYPDALCNIWHEWPGLRDRIVPLKAAQ